MEEQEKRATVPYFIHEGQMARMERIIRIVSTVFVIALLIVMAAFVINDNNWRRYCQNVGAQRTNEVTNAGVYQQPNAEPDK